MTPYQFGIKVAAELGIQPIPKAIPDIPKAPKAPSAGQPESAKQSPAFPPAAPGLNPAGRDIRTDQQAQMWRNYGSPMGATTYTRAPRPAQARPAPYAPNPEHQRILGSLQQQYPQFGQGDLQDMLSLHIQGRGGELAQFIRNTQQKYKSQPAVK